MIFSLKPWPINSTRTIIKQIQKKFLSRNPLVKKANERFFLSILQLVQGTKAKKILDCGCGEGMILKYLEDRIKDLKLFGFDTNQEALGLAQELIPRARLKTGSIYQIPFPANFAPLVLCTEVLEHLRAPHKALAELKRVTRYQTIVSVPHEPFFRLANMARLAYLKSFGNTPGHLNNWSQADFKQLVEPFFQIEKAVYPFPWMVFLLRVPDSKKETKKLSPAQLNQ